jgi:signal transduction histidine kinase
VWASTGSARALRALGAGGHLFVVPEVIFCGRCLERRRRAAQAGGMNPTLRRLLEPMNLAAYAAWAAIGAEMWAGDVPTTGLLSADESRALAEFLHGFFLSIFVLRQLVQVPRARDLAFVAAQLLCAMAIVALVKAGTAPILLVIVAAQAAQVLRLRTLAAFFLVGNAFMFALYSQLWDWTSPGLATLLHGSFQLFAMCAAWYAVTAERSRDALAAVNAELLATRSLLAESARDSERLRLARELHDVAGHSLTALKLNLRALQRQPALAHDEQLALCARLADELLADIRGVVQQMRLHDGVELDELLHRLAAPFPKPQLHVELDEGLRVPSLEQAEAVLRTVQEALTNAARHGGADNLWLRVHRQGEELRMDIRDDGRGSGGSLRFGNGLKGMRERLQAMGGGVEAEGGAQRGVRLSAWFPLAPAAREALEP